MQSVLGEVLKVRLDTANRSRPRNYQLSDVQAQVTDVRDPTITNVTCAARTQARHAHSSHPSIAAFAATEAARDGRAAGAPLATAISAAPLKVRLEIR